VRQVGGDQVAIQQLPKLGEGQAQECVERLTFPQPVPPSSATDQDRAADAG